MVPLSKCLWLYTDKHSVSPYRYFFHKVTRYLRNFIFSKVLSMRGFFQNKSIECTGENNSVLWSAGRPCSTATLSWSRSHLLSVGTEETQASWDTGLNPTSPSSAQKTKPCVPKPNINGQMESGSNTCCSRPYGLGYVTVLGPPLQSTVCTVMRKSWDLLQSGPSETAGMMSNLCAATKTAASVIYTFVLMRAIKICLVYSCSKYSRVSLLLYQAGPCAGCLHR